MALHHKITFWLPTIGASICVGLVVMWVVYEAGYEAGWVQGHNDGVVFMRKADRRTKVLSDETGTGRVIPQREHDIQHVPSISASLVEREVIGSDGKPVCIISITTRNRDGLLREASTEATAGPCRGRQIAK